jgi:hypothetical protein
LVSFSEAGRVETATVLPKFIFEVSAFVRRTPLEAAEAPKLLVLPAIRMTFADWLAQVPQRLWDRAAAGQMRIVFDASGEGRTHDPEQSRQTHAFLAARGVDPRTVSYITQDRGYGADYEAWRTAERAGPGMRILYADYFIRRFFFDLEARGAETFAHRLALFRNRAAHRPRRLISLNLSPRESKVLFLLRLMRDGLWDQAFVSFGGIGMNKRGKKPVYKRWKHEIAALAPELARLEAMGRFLLDGDGDNTSLHYRTPIYDVDLPQHGESWFTVVPETEMRDRSSRITEKACKALVNFHPLIFLGNPGSLDFLREYGFQTFEGFFDEAYDREADPRRRFDLVYDQVVALCRADEAELARRTAAVEEALVHNAHWGLTKLPGVIRRERDAALLRAVLA